MSRPLALVLGCHPTTASSPPTAAPAPEPPAPLTSEIRLETSGPVVGWLTSAAALNRSREAGDDLVVITTFRRPDATNARGWAPLEVRLPAAAARSLVPPDATPPIRVAYHHSPLLLDDEGTTVAQLECHPLAVLHEEPHRTRVRVEHEGVGEC